ncbi:hypothetical protein GC176_27630 [bacterium]|nr:hypothetical protein [bacterium]
MEKNKPVKTFRHGRVTVAVWLNRNEQGDTWYTYTITRSYQDGDTWKNTESYRGLDLPSIVILVIMACFWEMDRKIKDHPEPQNGDEADA